MTVAGLALLRRELKRAPLMPPDYDAEPHPMAGPQRTAAAPRGEDDAALAKLRTEEARQKPQEGRN